LTVRIAKCFFRHNNTAQFVKLDILHTSRTLAVLGSYRCVTMLDDTVRCTGDILDF
jgi:hypothetical protein